MRAAPSNAGRIAHLVAINAFVGAMVGLERTVLPLVADADFGVASKAAVLTFIATFGVAKATMNAAAGALSERWGRKRLLVGGWLLGIPVPLIIAMAPSWGWILAANVLLGVNQALTWSMTVVMKVDLAEPRQYGLVIGLNEFSGYAGMASTAAATGWVASRYALRPEPFYLGVVLAAVGFVLSLAAKDTTPPQVRQARRSTKPRTSGGAPPDATDDRVSSFRRIMIRSVWRDAGLSSASLSGLATNLKDGVLWGLLPILLASRGVAVGEIGVVVALYPMVWAVSQLAFGMLSDRIGRRGLIAGGLGVQGAGVALFALGDAYPIYLVAATTAGLGTGMVYPTLLAFVSETADAEWRATALGVYRFWRDLGYALGALGAGSLADGAGVETSMLVTAAGMIAAALAFHRRTGAT